jgi:hypothetical protein
MCCGGARVSLGQPPTRVDRRGEQGEERAVRFTYIGRTILTVVGSATRTLYRFDGAGATLAVDRRDAYGLIAVPTLRRVRDDG